VNNFVYFGNMIDNENRINMCVKERIQAGNKANFANNKLFKNKLISRSTKMRIYRTIVRPVVTYGSETWTLPTAEENALRIFERKILRKIYGPVTENGIWRNGYNDELNEIIKGEDIVRFITAQRIRWLGHVERMKESAMPKKDAGRETVLWGKKRTTKNGMAGRRDGGSGSDGNQRMERDDPEKRSLETDCRGSQGPPRAVAPRKKKKKNSL
jgi:hypothetical protein